MADIQGLFFEPRFGLLVCKVHRQGVHAEEDSIRRHLRGKGHYCKGRVLRDAVLTLRQLPLKSRQSLRDAHPLIDSQPIAPIPYLTISSGWSCRLCSGEFLTTSSELQDRHVAAVHQRRARSHCEEQPLWTTCELQTFFLITGDRQYFRVAPKGNMAGTAGPSEARSSSSKVYSDLNNKAQEQASQFIERLRVQQGQHEAIAAAAANVNPDSAARGARVELWMKKLGLDRYVAGLRKDEMAASYQSSETDDESGLHDLCEVSAKVLRETWQWCQHGPQQRMTDPQAARISSF